MKVHIKLQICNNIIFWLGCFFSMTIFLQFSCSKQTELKKIKDYVKEIESYRERKDRQFKNGSNSPLTKEQIPTFNGLKYFPADFFYKVEAQFIPNTDPVTFQIQTSTAEERTYIKNGRLEFNLSGINYILITYQDKDLDEKKGFEHLFVPFTDETTGKQTYGGGRYLDLKINEGNNVTIDFNLAYNPYCAYNLSYSCPLPPRENHLFANINAGEKKYK